MNVAVLGPYPKDTGSLVGVESAIVYALRALVNVPGLTLHVITCRPDCRELRTVAQEGLQVTYMPRSPLGRVTWHSREVRQIQRVLRDVRPDVVHAHGTGLYAGAAVASSYPAVVTVHALASREARLLRSPAERLRGVLDSMYERAVMRRASHLIAISPYVQQALGDVFHGKSYLVENACDDSFFAIQRQPEPGRILMAGPVKVRKGILPLLRAFRLVLDQEPWARLRIAGSTTVEPEYAGLCQAYVRDAGLEGNVAFLGQLSEGDVLHEYAHCAALVLPSFEEVAPLVIEQAMAAGVPVVATRAGGIPWMLRDGETGLTLPVPPTLQGEPHALADALLRVLQSPEQASLLGLRAKAEAEARFRPRHIAQQTYDVYCELAGRGL